MNKRNVKDIINLHRQIYHVIKSGKFKTLNWSYIVVIACVMNTYQSQVSLIYPVLFTGISFAWLNLFKSDNMLEIEKTYTSDAALTDFNTMLTWFRFLFLYILKLIYIMLWSLLLIIPGIYKSIQYSMSEFIYRDNYEALTFRETLEQSSKLMKSHTWEYILMKLSLSPYYISCLSLMYFAHYISTLSQLSKVYYALGFVALLLSLIIYVYTTIVSIALKAGFYHNILKLESLKHESQTI